MEHKKYRVASQNASYENFKKKKKKKVVLIKECECMRAKYSDFECVEFAVVLSVDFLCVVNLGACRPEM